MSLDHCPACRTDSLNAFAWAYASWPFFATCSSCGVRVRRRQNLWLGAFCQPLALGLAVLSVIYGASPGGSSLLGAIGVAVAVVIIFLPVLFGRYVAINGGPGVS